MGDRILDVWGELGLTIFFNIYIFFKFSGVGMGGNLAAFTSK